MADRGKGTKGAPVHELPTLQVHRGGEGPIAPVGDDEETTIAALVRTFVNTIRRRWKLVMAVWLLVAVPVAAYAVTSVPEYVSRGSVQVSEGGGISTNPLLELAGGAGQADVHTEVEIIRRREFLSDGLRALRLQVIDPAQAKLVTPDLDVMLGGESPVREEVRSIRSAVVVAEVPRGHYGPTSVAFTAVDESQLRVEIGEEEPEVRTIEIGERLEHPDVVLELSEMPLAVGQSFRVEILPEGELLKEYAGRISVRSLGTLREPTNIVQITARHPDRATARAIVETLIERYLQKTLDWQSKSASQAAEFIEHQLEIVRADLRKAEDNLLAFSRTEHAVQLDTQAKVAIERSAELEAQRLGLELQEKTIGGVLRRVRGGGSKGSVTAPFFDDPVLTRAIDSLAEAETRHETLSASMTADHPQVQETGRALEFQRKEVAKLMKSAQKNVASQRKQIEGELAAADEAMTTYPDKQLELARLTRDMELSQRLYTMLLEKLEEAEIVKASTTTDKRVVDAANVPYDHASPRRGALLALGGLGGLALALASAVFARLLQRRMDTVEAVREMVRYPTYGTVPEAPADGRPQRWLTVADLWKNEHDPIAEAFQALAVSVTLAPSEADRGKLIMLTSSQPGEGKSTVSANLAEALGRTGKRVLLLDLDLRKPVQHRLWAQRREPGYSDLIGRNGTAEDIDTLGRVIDGRNATVLPAGTRLPDSVAALMTPALETLLADWSRMFDYVIIDSPPAFVAETRAVARHADLLLLVARPGVLERPSLRHALEGLERVDVAKGLVLNSVGKQHADYKYGAGYYYYASSPAPEDAERAAS